VLPFCTESLQKGNKHLTGYQVAKDGGLTTHTAPAKRSHDLTRPPSRSLDSVTKRWNLWLPRLGDETLRARV